MPARRVSRRVMEQLRRDVAVPEPPPAPRRTWWPWLLGGALILLYISVIAIGIVTSNAKAARRREQQRVAARQQTPIEKWRAEGYSSAEHKRVYEEDYQRRMREWQSATGVRSLFDRALATGNKVAVPASISLADFRTQWGRATAIRGSDGILYSWPLSMDANGRLFRKERYWDYLAMLLVPDHGTTSLRVTKME